MKPAKVKLSSPVKVFISLGWEFTLCVNVRNVVSIISASHDPVFNLAIIEKVSYTSEVLEHKWQRA